MEIKFYGTKNTYGCFSNFSKHPIKINDKMYKTVEHYFQSRKFKDLEYRRKIRKAENPLIAKRLGGTRNIKLRSDWEEIKDDVMYKAVYTKFKQHKDIRKILLNTGNSIIIENSPYDYYWGCGKTGIGKNKLGKILMKVRKDLS